MMQNTGTNERMSCYTDRLCVLQSTKSAKFFCYKQGQKRLSQSQSLGTI